MKNKTTSLSEHTCSAQSLGLLKHHQLQERIIHSVAKHTFHFPGQCIRLSMVF